MYTWNLDALLPRHSSSSSSSSGGGGTSFSLLLSGSKPCTAFRLWLHPRGVEGVSAAGPPGGSSRSSGSDRLNEHAGHVTDEEHAGRAIDDEYVASVLPASLQLNVTVDVTSLAVCLPPLLTAGRLPVRVWR